MRNSTRIGRQTYGTLRWIGWILLSWLALPLILAAWAVLGCWLLLTALYQLTRRAAAGAVWAYRATRSAQRGRADAPPLG
jgi:hypothetical protein